MCEWNVQDGLTISLQKIYSTLALARLINRTLILHDLPASAVMRQVRIFIPFADLFDINALRRAYGSGCCALSAELNESVRNHTRVAPHMNDLFYEFHGNKSQLIAHKHIRVCRMPIDLILKANITSVYENTQPHPSLKKIIQFGWNQLQSVQTVNTNSHPLKKPAIVCMHLRTETDFMYFFRRAPATYTREQILAKMNLTRIKHPDTSFAKLWSEDDNYSVKPVLYLAGDDRKDAKEFFLKTGWFSTVEDKNTIFVTTNKKRISFAQLLVQYNTPSSLLNSLQFEVNTPLAIIDFEICKKADVFIGNNHSSLSERIATERQRSVRWEGNATRTLENGGRYNYMVNSLGEDATSWEDFSKLDPLNPFCSRNSFIFLSYKCEYVRARMPI